MTAGAIKTVTLDDASIIRRAAEVEHERRVAMVDLAHSNELTLLAAPELTPPYDLFISVRENRLTLRFTDSETRTADITLPLQQFRSTIKDYFLMCENYYEALRNAPGDRLQTLDMARRAVHNDGSELLKNQLSDRIEMDFATARRLFTLISVLHIK